jgi:hypothetical protein
MQSNQLQFKAEKAEAAELAGRIRELKERDNLHFKKKAYKEDSF